jgi:AcrR family transcriptional regulator
MSSQSTVVFTREQLYQRVWSRPLRLVAREFGVSGNALAKICSRMLVPYPSRGYWAKVRGGGASVRPPLPTAPEANMRRVKISSERAASRRTRTRLRPSERREQLTEVAKEIILKEGMHAATMKRIAAQAGVSETQAYNYFGSQEKLFVALAIGETRKIRAAQIAEVSQFEDHYAQVIASTRTYLRQIDRRSDLLQVLLRNPQVRAGLRKEHRQQGNTDRNVHAQHLVELYGIPWEVAVGCTVILSRLCGRAAKLIADKRIALEAAERMCLAIVLHGSRGVIGAYRDAAGRSQGPHAA